MIGTAGLLPSVNNLIRQNTPAICLGRIYGFNTNAAPHAQAAAARIAEALKPLGIEAMAKGGPGPDVGPLAAKGGAESNIAGFGKFKVKETPEREGRNPSTGATIKIAAAKKLLENPGAAWVLFSVPMVGSRPLLGAMIGVFIVANLAVGFTFSTLARNQLQAVQMTLFFFLPSMLLSGFMFPFAGMPRWAQWIGEVLPLTHFLRIVRGIMLKGSTLAELLPELWALLAFTVVVSAVALLRYRQTLD